MKQLLILLLIQLVATTQAQTLNLVSPSNATTTVNNPKQFITGTTCAGCTITVNNTTVKVYSTLVFVYQATLVSGVNTFQVNAQAGNKTITKQVIYNYTPAKPITATDSNIIESISILPSGNVALQVGDVLSIRVKAKPNCSLFMADTITLTEQPASANKGVAGYYTTQYMVTAASKLLLTSFVFSLRKNSTLLHTLKDKNLYSLFNSTSQPTIAKVNSPYTPIYSGISEDRLGGTKIGFLDTSVLLQPIARYNNLYKVQLLPNYHVYIPISNLTLLPQGNPIPQAVSQNISVTGDSLYDYLRITFDTKLPYLTQAIAKPNQLLLDIFGASLNTNWIMQYPETLQVIENVDATQLQNQQIRLTINLAGKQLWGYKSYYEGNTLVVQIRRQKQNLNLSNMRIALDAGHGGSNLGALGIAGRYEKEFTLLIAQQLQTMLLVEGATTSITRTSDASIENQERLNNMRKTMPDFAISIHLNSAADPLRVKGYSTYYKYNAYRGLSQSIYNNLSGLGLTGWGVTGNFNFFLNSATEFPTALIECLFISNPADEEKVHDPAFRTQFCKKIILGIKDWLQNCSTNK